MKQVNTSQTNRAVSFVWIVAVLVLGVMVGACGGESDDDDGDAVNPVVTPVVQTDATGAVSFAITDAPVDNAKNLFLTIAKLEVSKAADTEETTQVSLAGGAGSSQDTSTSTAVWIEIPLEQSVEFDLLSLQDGMAAALAGLNGLAVGQYNQIRLFLDDATSPRLVLEDDSVNDVFIPSVTKSGIKIVSPFDIEEGKTLDLTIDFDVRKSLHAKGSIDLDATDSGNSDRFDYILSPTLRLVKDSQCGEISGATLEAAIACAYEKGDVKDETPDCANAMNSAKVKNGEYTLAYMPEGEYDVRLFDADGTYVDVEESQVVVAE